MLLSTDKNEYYLHPHLHPIPGQNPPHKPDGQAPNTEYRGNRIERSEQADPTIATVDRIFEALVHAAHECRSDFRTCLLTLATEAQEAPAAQAAAA